MAAVPARQSCVASPQRSLGEKSVTQPSHRGATFAARAPVVVMRRKTIEEEAGGHFRTSGLWSYVRPSFAVRLQSQTWRVSSRCPRCIAPRFFKPSRTKVCPLSPLGPLLLRGPSRKLSIAGPRKVALIVWASRQAPSGPSPSGTRRVLRLNKKSGRIWPARSTGRQMSEFIEIEGEVKRAGSEVGFAPAVGRAVAPAVGPQVASTCLQSGPIPHRSADRGDSVLPTYLRHPEESA
jgi:hypothetical protein